MIKYMKYFVFTDSVDKLLSQDNEFLAQIPIGIKQTKYLFIELQRALSLPDYFGHNFDALDECLRDFEWVDQYSIILAHDDLPDLSKQDTVIYLDVIGSAADIWHRSPEHELKIFMPFYFKSRVKNFLSI